METVTGIVGKRSVIQRMVGREPTMGAVAERVVEEPWAASKGKDADLDMSLL
jgi:hypothetical protein